MYIKQFNKCVWSIEIKILLTKNISHDIEESLGPNPENETNAIDFFKNPKYWKYYKIKTTILLCSYL